MEQDELSDVIDGAYPGCPACGTRLVDAGSSAERARLKCPSCGLDVVAGY